MPPPRPSQIPFPHVTEDDVRQWYPEKYEVAEMVRGLSPLSMAICGAPLPALAVGLSALLRRVLTLGILHPSGKG